MERRLLLAILLSFVAVMGYSTLTGKCSPPPPKPDPKEGTPGPDGQPAPVSPDGTPAPSPSPTPAPGEDGPQKDVAEDATPAVLRNDDVEATFTSRGAGVRSIRLLKIFETDKKTPLDLVVPVDDTMLLGQIDDQALVPKDGAPGGPDRHDDPPGEMRRLHWTRDAAEETRTPESDLVYTFRTADGRTFRKAWTLGSGDTRYQLAMNLSVTGAKAPQEVKVLVASGLLREPTAGSVLGVANNAATVLTSDLSEPPQAPWGFEVTNLSPEGTNPRRALVLGARTLYFLTAWFQPTPPGAVPADAPQVVRFWATGDDAVRSGKMQENVRAWFEQQSPPRPVPTGSELAARIAAGVEYMNHTWMVVRLPADAAATPPKLTFYAGPIEREVLRSSGHETLDPVIEYSGALDFLADFLLWIYDRFRDIFASAGVAVILMTFVVRGGLMPLSIKNQLSMRRYGRKIQKLKPKLEEIKKKHASNPKRLRDETMKLYREHGIGFPLGCFMLLFQIPIFFALFSCLRAEYSLRNTGFLWIWDLSGPDRLVSLPFSFTIPILGGIMGPVSSINVLPIVYLFLTVWQQKMMPKPMDDQQAQQMRMMKWLPFVFAILLYNYTAALALYMITSSLLAIAESKIVRRLDEKSLAAAAVPAPA